MLESVPLDEVVIYCSGMPSNGHAPGHRPEYMEPKPMMLSEAIMRALQNLQAGGRPTIRVRGLEVTELEDFLRVLRRPDFPR